MFIINYLKNLQHMHKTIINKISKTLQIFLLTMICLRNLRKLRKKYFHLRELRKPFVTINLDIFNKIYNVTYYNNTKTSILIEIETIKPKYFQKLPKTSKKLPCIKMSIFWPKNWKNISHNLKMIILVNVSIMVRDPVFYVFFQNFFQ